MASSSSIRRVALTPQVSGVGGMVTFQAKLSAGLAARGVEVTQDVGDPATDAVLIIGGTRRLAALRRARERGIPIVQRLDGINWLHRRRPTGPLHWLRAEFGNLLLATIRRRIATHIVYQSEFVRGWWERVYGAVDAPHTVIHNGVDLDLFSPEGPEQPPTDRFRILLVEGSLRGGYEWGLESALALAEFLHSRYAFKMELMVAGRADARLRARMERDAQFPIHWQGELPNAEIPSLNRSAHILYSADLNPACPNAVIEALACGLPVVGFKTGALEELVTPAAGRLAAYGGDPWKLEAPDIPALAGAAEHVLSELPAFRRNARARAQQAFRLEDMVSKYLGAFGAQGA